MGMGIVSGAADNTDPSNIYANPANVAGSERVYLIGSQADFKDTFFTDFTELDWSLRRGTAGGSWKFDEASAWTFGANFSFARFGYGYEGGWEDVSDQVMALAGGAGLTLDVMEVRIGGAVKRLSATTPDFTEAPETYEVDGYAYDLGIVVGARRSSNGWSVFPQAGIALIDMGSDLEFRYGNVSLPKRFNIGGSVRVTGPTINLAGAEVPKFVTVVNLAAVNHDGGEAKSYGMGAEVSAAQALFLRGGARFTDGVNDEFTWGIGFGFPIKSFRARFDYSHAEYGLTDEHMSLLLAWVL